MDVRLVSWMTYVWIQAQIWDVQGYQSGPVDYVSEKDISLLEADKNPKCFTRTLEDFTCFWEVSDDTSYDFFYKTDEQETTCNLTRQKAGGGRSLQVCSLPASDVFLYAVTDIRVVERSTNRTVLNRSVSVEDQVLLDPPTNVSLSFTGEAAQLRVTWHMDASWQSKVQYEIRHSANNLVGSKILMKASLTYMLDSLITGEVCCVQLRVRPNGYNTRGYWSDWSQPAAALVPQRAEDIDLLCHTSDLRNIQCQWKEQSFKEEAHCMLFYQLSPRGSWQQCMFSKSPGQCIFSGLDSSIMRVNLRIKEGPHEWNFYTESFAMDESIKPDPPKVLSWGKEGTRLRIEWEPPLWNLSAHLEYQIRYRCNGESMWKLVILQSPNNSTTLDVQAGTQYHIQVQTKPNGSIYKGIWSDWSNTLCVDVPLDTEMVFVAGIFLISFIVVALLITSFSRNIRKIKQLLWPPVPNLEKVLEGFLADINRECQSQTFSVKQCYEETPASVVEIVHEKKPFEGGKGPKEGVLQLLLEGKTVGECITPLETCPDYITLNPENVISSLRSNEYVSGGGHLVGVGLEVWQAGHPCSCPCPSSGFTQSMDLLNQSYLLPAEMGKGLGFRELASRYTNLELATYPAALD
ncbi:thrombopoietin receptor [Paramormyrops kingsleyae]|uniref:MPL proto-oncogene, thrombopoietin receptor n=1 Tax=Paramormyrops kingsleyae TaxID=1676925 RepID=A0A3B3SLH0_9TELE|nr:thrombopoietin receptor [Paramormyrops kingsleyae]